MLRVLGKAHPGQGTQKGSRGHRGQPTGSRFPSQSTKEIGFSGPPLAAASSTLSGVGLPLWPNTREPLKVEERCTALRYQNLGARGNLPDSAIWLSSGGMGSNGRGWGGGRPGSWCRTEKVWDDLVLVILLKKQVSLLFKNSNTQKQKEEYHEPHVPITQIQQLSRQKSF